MTTTTTGAPWSRIAATGPFNAWVRSWPDRLDTQRVTIYDTAGRIQQSPVSTGQTGLETPAGIFSVVQKNEVHRSNLYEDGNMPFMQRITWTGIAMHAGVLPGHPASHGCVACPSTSPASVRPDRRRPARDHRAPRHRARRIRSPAPLRSNAAPVELPTRPANSSRALADPLQTMRSIASSKASEADAAERKASEARRAAMRNAAEAASAAKALHAAEAGDVHAEEQLKHAEKALDAVHTSGTPQVIKRAETAKEKAAVELVKADMQLEAAKARAQAKTDAVVASEETAKAAEAASDAAQDAATEAKRKTLPISVFVSRKTQRFYVRQGYVPVSEGPITIQDPDKPLGTYVFTAFGEGGEGVRWGVVSMYAELTVRVPPSLPRRATPRARARPAVASRQPADVAGAKTALDRIAIPQKAIQRISDVVLPGSSLIVSDEGLSIETGKDTDFVVVMSGELQGALKIRQREPGPPATGAAPPGLWQVPLRRRLMEVVNSERGCTDLPQRLRAISDHGFSSPLPSGCLLRH